MLYIEKWEIVEHQRVLLLAHPTLEVLPVKLALKLHILLTI